MNDERIRESLRACLSDSRFPAQCQREVLERIHGEQPLMKRKIPYAVVLAAALLLAMSALAVAAGLGVFGSLKDNLNGEINGARLERLDQAADSVGAGASISVYAADPAPNATDYDRILAAQGKRTFGLTIHQAYCDGRKLYYSYTLTTNKKELTLGKGKPTGISSWEWAEPGKTFKDVWSFDDQETQKKISDWLDGGSSRYAAMDSVGVGDGVSIDDGSEKGVPTMILDSAEEWLDETTLQGFQEVELPEDYEIGDSIALQMSILYSTTVFYQDETGVYRIGVRQADNRGILRVPFTVTANGNAQEMTGTFHAQDYCAHATLTFTDVTAYGEVVFESAQWAEAYQAETDYWMNGGEGEPPVLPDMITSYQLIAGSEVLANIGGGFGLNEDGKYHVYLEFDLPKDMSSLSLRPTDRAFDSDVIPLNAAP